MADVQFMLSSTFFGRCTEFIVGIALGLWQKINKTLEIIDKATFWGVTCILIGVGTLAIIERAIRDASGPPLPVYILVNNFILPFPIALLLWELVREVT